MNADRDLAAQVDAAIEAAGDGDIVAVEIARLVQRDHPDECNAIGNRAVLRFIVGMVERRMKPTSDAPTLPGFGMPNRLAIPTEGGNVWRAAVRCTRDDLDAHERLLVDGIARDRDGLRRFRLAKRKVVIQLEQHGVDCLADLAVAS